MKIKLPQDLRRNFRRAALAGVAGWFLGMILAQQAGMPAPGWVAAAMLAAVLCALPLVLTGLVLDRLRKTERELRAMVNLRPMCGPWPLLFEDPAMDAPLAELAARLVAEERPRLIVECGSGSSTVILAACLRQLGAGRLVSLEHSPEYAEKTRANLRLAGLASWAVVVTAPLKTHHVRGQEMLWYDVQPDTLPDTPIDLLVVDGPPRRVARRARFPAVPVLRQHLSDRCAVLADDGSTRDVRSMVREWSELLDCAAEFHATRKGAWLLRIPAAKEP